MVVTLPYRSLMRLKQRSSVVLPQPEGPIRAVIMPGLIWILTSFSAWNSPYHRFSPRVWMRVGRGRVGCSCLLVHPRSPVTYRSVSGCFGWVNIVSVSLTSISCAR